MGSEIAQAQFYLGQLVQMVDHSDLYEEEKRKLLDLVDMIHNLLTHGAETQHKAALGEE
jgi:hypothetical protein